MNNPKNDAYYIEKILTDLRFIVRHTADISRQELEENEVLLDSMMFRLIQLHENAQRLTDAYKASRTDIPWRDISGLRNRVVHDYGNVNLEIVYVTLTADVPMLISLFERQSLTKNDWLVRELILHKPILIIISKFFQRTIFSPSKRITPQPSPALPPLRIHCL